MENSEIGTGFYVEKKPSETNDFLDRKLKIVDANSENITKAVQATRYVQNYIIESGVERFRS
jgi:prefoldin subunit 5